MKLTSTSLSLASMTAAIGLFASAAAFGQAPSGAPAGSTGLCKDGAYVSTATKRGACKGHQGVKDWYATGATGAATSSGTMAAAPASPSIVAAPAQPATPAVAAGPSVKGTRMADRVAAPGGGNGQVWVNTKTKVYHCQSDKAYGKTKEGAYMSEAAAKAAGDHASHGKACAT